MQTLSFRRPQFTKFYEKKFVPRFKFGVPPAFMRSMECLKYYATTSLSKQELLEEWRQQHEGSISWSDQALEEVVNHPEYWVIYNVVGHLSYIDRLDGNEVKKFLTSGAFAEWKETPESILEWARAQLQDTTISQLVAAFGIHSVMRYEEALYQRAELWCAFSNGAKASDESIRALIRSTLFTLELSDAMSRHWDLIVAAVLQNAKRKGHHLKQSENLHGEEPLVEGIKTKGEDELLSAISFVSNMADSVNNFHSILAHTGEFFVYMMLEFIMQITENIEIEDKGVQRFPSSRKILNRWLNFIEGDGNLENVQVDDDLSNVDSSQEERSIIIQPRQSIILPQGYVVIRR